VEDCVESNDSARLDRLKRAAEADKGLDDPQAFQSRYAAALIVMICAALVVAIGVVGAMYLNDQDSTGSVPVAQSPPPGR